MARIRTIKPGFFMNDELAGLAPLTRLLFIGLWTMADRAGRIEDRPARIKAQVLPYDDCDVDDMLADLHDAGFIIRYETNQARYLQVTNFTKHQQPNVKEIASTIPAPCQHGDNTVPAHQEGNRKEQEQKEIMPPVGDDDLPFSEPPLTEPFPDEEPEAQAIPKAVEPVLKPCRQVPEWKKSARFLEFKAKYKCPEVRRKWGDAWKAWKKFGCDDDEIFVPLMAALEAHLKSFEWRKDGGAYIPAPDVWIGDEHWHNFEADTAPPNPYAHKPWGAIYQQHGFPATEMAWMNLAAKAVPRSDPHEAGQEFKRGGVEAAGEWLWQQMQRGKVVTA